jgi:molecular chaperone GrpE (heat shock protein)
LAFYLRPLQRAQRESEREQRSKKRRRRKKKRRKSKDLASSPLPIFDPVSS